VAGTGVDPRGVALATGGAVVASAAWYTAFGRQLAQLDEAYAEGGSPPAWVLPVELARSATVATAVAVLAQRTDTRGPAGAARLATGLWAAFPAVLLTGSVVHEKVPWRLAAVHSGDWLLKLLLISGVVAGRSRRRRG
jgi:hypothetical protein